MEMRKCKECGKLFMPKGREQYCSAIHYRPCPVCGKPVEAKYLSDPARCCSKECQAVLRSASKKHVDVSKPKAAVQPIVHVDEDESKMTASEAVAKYSEYLKDSLDKPRKYQGPDNLLGFKAGHEYLIDISKKPNCAYEISAYKDCTTSEVVDLFITLSSMIAINRYFAKCSD